MSNVQQLTVQVTTLGVKTDQISQVVTKLDHELFGNGRPGLVVQMAEMRQQMKLCLWVFGGIGSACFAVLTGILLAVAT